MLIQCSFAGWQLLRTTRYIAWSLEWIHILYVIQSKVAKDLICFEMDSGKMTPQWCLTLPKCWCASVILTIEVLMSCLAGTKWLRLNCLPVWTCFHSNIWDKLLKAHVEHILGSDSQKCFLSPFVYSLLWCVSDCMKMTMLLLLRKAQTAFCQQIIRCVECKAALCPDEHNTTQKRLA